MKIFLLILSTLFFYGCQGNTVKGKHLVLEKTGDVTVLKSNDTFFTEIRHKYGIYGADDGTDKYLKNKAFIVIPYKIVSGHINGPEVSAIINIYLCNNGNLNAKRIPTTYNPESRKFPDDFLILLSKNLLSSNNLLNDDGTIKGDICIEPNINNLAGTMKPEDHFEVTKEEMDRALEELYTVLGE